jgi:PGF-CTERM protein
MMKVGIPAILYRYFGIEWLLERVLTAMATQPNPEPIVRKNVGAPPRYVNLERELTSASADDGAYEFEFELHGAAEGEAEVAVDGETGTVFEFEESVESGDDDSDGDDRERRRDDSADEDGPGMGVLAGLASVVGAGYLLSRGEES